MANTYFIENSTPIVSAWLNDVNNYVYASTSVNRNRGTVVATASQALFTVPFTYVVGSKSLHVYANGLHQVLGTAYTETSSSTITFNSGISAGVVVEFVIG
jgi:hypothetical protein